MKIDLKQLRKESKKSGYRSLAAKYNCSIATISRLLNAKQSRSKKAKKSKIVNIRHYNKVNDSELQYFPLWEIDVDYNTTISKIAKAICRKWNLKIDVSLAVEYTINKCYSNANLTTELYKSFIIYTLRSYLFNHYSKNVSLDTFNMDVFNGDANANNEYLTNEYILNVVLNNAKRELHRMKKTINIHSLAMFLYEKYFPCTLSLKRIENLLTKIVNG